MPDEGLEVHSHLVILVLLSNSENILSAEARVIHFSTNRSVSMPDKMQMRYYWKSMLWVYINTYDFVSVMIIDACPNHEIVIGNMGSSIVINPVLIHQFQNPRWRVSVFDFVYRISIAVPSTGVLVLVLNTGNWKIHTVALKFLFVCIL